MRLSSTALGIGVALALLTACSGGLPQSVPGAAPLVPEWTIRHVPFRGVKAPQSATRGIYVAEFFLTSNNVVGFPKNQTANGPPICYESTGGNVNDVDPDGRGNLLIPAAAAGVQVYQGPAMCGPLLGSIADPYGSATDAAANDAVNGVTIIATASSSGAASVVTCRFSSATCNQLSSPNLVAIASVAMDKAGNCYADGFDTSGHVGLWVYAACAGTGTEVTSMNGFNEPYYGGMSVDNNGNLVVLSLLNSSFSTPSTATIYAGCRTGTCTVTAGPISLQGESAFGHLGRQNERWVTANLSTGMIDIYAYTGRGAGLTYMYSFNDGLTCATNVCESAAYSPASPRI